MLVGLVIFLAIALVLALAYIFFGSHGTEPVAAHRPQQALAADSAGVPSLQAELDKRKKENDEQRTQLQELKAELKQAKKKLYEQKEAGKGDQDLAKARADVERNASVQLEQARSELATVLGELQKLRESAGRPRRETHAAPVAPPAPVIAAPPIAEAPPAPVERPERKARELNDAERERLERSEHIANKERGRAVELEREVKRLKGRVETQSRVYTVTKGELDLVKDKFKALEKRLNRTLLEKDLLQRAVKDLAVKAGVDAGRTELTADEIAASDKKVEERIAADAKAQSEAQARAEEAAKAAAGTPATEPAPGPEQAS
jgi:DNA repair exonuclease SbcCD ATPase subunit